MSKMLFHVASDEGSTIVTICPKDFFEEEGCCADSGEQESFDAAMDGLDDRFFEVSDATFEFDGSVEEAIDILSNDARFERDESFDEHMNAQYV